MKTLLASLALSACCHAGVILYLPGWHPNLDSQVVRPFADLLTERELQKSHPQFSYVFDNRTQLTGYVGHPWKLVIWAPLAVVEAEPDDPYASGGPDTPAPPRYDPDPPYNPDPRPDLDPRPNPDPTCQELGNCPDPDPDSDPEEPGNPVPEPSAATLLSLGIVVASRMRMRRRRRG